MDKALTEEEVGNLLAELRSLREVARTVADMNHEPSCINDDPAAGYEDCDCVKGLALAALGRASKGEPK